MSSSRSSTAQQTYQQDNRRVIGERGVSAENSTVTINALDAEVINRMFDSNDRSNKLSFDFGGKALDFGNEALLASMGFGKSALNAALNANSDALAFADANSTRNTLASYNFASDALSFADANAARSTIASYNFANDALGGALGFGAAAMNKAFSAADQTGAMVKDAYADAKGRGALTDKILMGAIAAMAVVALMAVKK